MNLSAVGSSFEKKNGNIPSKHQMKEPIEKHQMYIILTIHSKNTQKVKYNLKKLLLYEKMGVNNVDKGGKKTGLKTGGLLPKRESWNL